MTDKIKIVNADGMGNSTRVYDASGNDVTTAMCIRDINIEIDPRGMVTANLVCHAEIDLNVVPKIFVMNPSSSKLDKAGYV